MDLDGNEQQMISAIKDATKNGVTVLDLLIGVRYSTVFDKRGFGRTAKSAARRCRRTMLDIVEAHGHTPPTGNVVTLSIAARKLQAHHLALTALVSQHCPICGRFREGLCKGVDRSNVVALKTQAKI